MTSPRCFILGLVVLMGRVGAPIFRELVAFSGAPRWKQVGLLSGSGGKKGGENVPDSQQQMKRIESFSSQHLFCIFKNCLRANLSQINKAEYSLKNCRFSLLTWRSLRRKTRRLADLFMWSSNYSLYWLEHLKKKEPWNLLNFPRLCSLGSIRKNRFETFWTCLDWKEIISIPILINLK